MQTASWKMYITNLLKKAHPFSSKPPYNNCYITDCTFRSVLTGVKMISLKATSMLGTSIWGFLGFKPHNNLENVFNVHISLTKNYANSVNFATRVYETLCMIRSFKLYCAHLMVTLLQMFQHDYHILQHCWIKEIIIHHL